MPRVGGRNPRGFLTEEEKANKPVFSFALLKRIFSYLLPYWYALAAVFAIIIISSYLGLLPSIITSKIIDEAILGKNFTLLLKLVAAAFGTMLASRIVAVLESHINAWVSSKIIYDMRNEMYAHLQGMSHSFFTSEKQGDIITRMNSDISGISSVISGTLTSFVSNVCTVVTTVIALFNINVELALIGIIIVPFLIIPTQGAGKSRWELLTEGQAQRDELNDIINESLSASGSLLIKLFTQEENKLEQFKDINGRVTSLSVKEQRAGQWFRVIMGIFTNLGPLMIYLAGGYLILKKGADLTVGNISAVIAMVNRLYRPVESLLTIQVDFTRSLALFTRIFDYLDRKQDIVSKENAVKPDFSSTDIEYDKVVFNYSEDVPLLNDLSFRIPNGKMYAIVGPSGSGKSTIVNLLPRLFDVKGGKITINGIDIRDIDLKYLRENIGVVTQEAYLFNGTIRENLMFAKNDATEEELIEACKIANIHDFIMSQPKGYDTECGNRGLKLSGGEKQRISIARVILKDPKILILDEATSSLDSISESSIQQALDVLMKGRTSIVIAHRLSTILASDRILVVSNGKIIEQGKHEELVEAGGVYKQLYETQFRKVIDMELEKA